MKNTTEQDVKSNCSFARNFNLPIVSELCQYCQRNTEPILCQIHKYFKTGNNTFSPVKEVVMTVWMLMLEEVQDAIRVKISSINMKTYFKFSILFL